MNENQTRSRPVPWLVAGFMSLGGIIIVAMTPTAGRTQQEWLGDSAWLILLPALFSCLGAVIATRQSGNRIAWIMYVVATAVLVDGAAIPLVSRPPVDPSFIDYLAIVALSSTWMFLFFPLFLLLFLFPNGSFLTRRWRWGGWLALSMSVVFLLVVGLNERVGDAEGSWTIENPIGIVPATIWEGPFGALWNIGLLTLAFGGLVAMVVRFRRSNLVVRTQVKWVLYATVVFAFTYGWSVFYAASGAGYESIVTGVLLTVALITIPVSITMAIVKFHLFDIDRVISRTISYALVVALVAGVYFGLVSLIASILPDTANSLAVAASTLAVAASFNPLRSRVQRAVDRRFNRSAHQADVVSEAFAGHLRSSLTIDEIVDLFRDTAASTFQPSIAGAWARSDGSPAQDK